jgi:hypothetical protein
MKIARQAPVAQGEEFTVTRAGKEVPVARKGSAPAQTFSLVSSVLASTCFNCCVFSRNAASLNIGCRIFDPLQLGGAVGRDMLAHLLAADLALARSPCGKSSLLHVIPQLGEV